MRRLTLLVALTLFGCGSDSAPARPVDDTNNLTGGTNGSTNTNGDTSDTNGDTTSETNSGTNGQSNSGTNGETNGETTTNGGTLPPGAIRVRSRISPNRGKVGATITHSFLEMTNFTLDPDNIGGEHVPGFGHYHIYLDTVDPANELLESATSPDTFVLELADEITVGEHDLVIRVHKNDHTEYTTPLEIRIKFTVEDDQ